VIGVTVAAAFTLTVHFVLIRRILAVSFWQIVAQGWRSLVSVGVMVAVVGALKNIWPPSTQVPVAFLQLLADAGAGAVTYVVVHLLLWRLSGCPRGAEQMIVRELRARIQRIPSINFG
jgi:hypothetical protein